MNINMRISHKISSLAFILFFISQPLYAGAPQQASAIGYNTNTFSSTFSGDIDLNDERTSNFKWFLGQFFGGKPTNKNDLVINKDGSLVITDGGNGAIGTAAPVNNSKKWVGTAFGGGGYFEAELKFTPQQVIAANGNGWPAFWSMAIEHLANLPTQQWQGQKQGYSHFIEVDFMEYMLAKTEGTNVYGGNMHDWFGVWKQTCANYCNIPLPYNVVKRVVSTNIDFTKYHKFGFLWVPATSAFNGWGQFYFDNVPTGSRTIWKIFNGQSPSQGMQPWTFGILDQQHIALILGTGANEPLTVRSVNVWQASSAKNLEQ